MRAAIIGCASISSMYMSNDEMYVSTTFFNHLTVTSHTQFMAILPIHNSPPHETLLLEMNTVPAIIMNA